MNLPCVAAGIQRSLFQSIFRADGVIKEQSRFAAAVLFVLIDPSGIFLASGLLIVHFNIWGGSFFYRNRFVQWNFNGHFIIFFKILGSSKSRYG